MYVTDASLRLAGSPEGWFAVAFSRELNVGDVLSFFGEGFVDSVLWPEFDKAEFDRALSVFAGKQRRFGQTGDQVEAAEC